MEVIETLPLLSGNPDTAVDEKNDIKTIIVETAGGVPVQVTTIMKQQRFCGLCKCN
jgi:hypothetical protein